MVLQNAKPMTNSLIKPYLKKLTLQVHPDFFHGDAIKKQHNANMLQQLYTVLDPILRPTASTMLTEPTRLTFYNKRSSTQRRRSSPTIIPGVVFATPKQPWPTIQTFFSLCQQLDISILPSDRDAVQAMIRQQTTQTPQRKPPRSLQQEFADALYKDHQQQQQQQQVTGGMILDQPLFMCDPKLNRQHVADRMAQWLPQLHPELWWGRLPTLYLSSSTRLEEDRTKGILILHDDMTLEEMNAYIQQYLPTKLKEHKDQSP
ncbi:hypothetical protein [Absidia glauca]|uniref:DUF4460 domain-containing protein n=1 Tax=Absidia glauca TaxID=4829 RepID=A0A168N5A1_ABSGL|nr:hypothetical protein [Absidia glauca]